MFHGKDKTDRAKHTLQCVEKSLLSGCIYPLSEVHYMEFARIRDPARRARLGQAMHYFSKGKSLVSIREVVEYEIESVLIDFIPDIKPGKLDLVGSGVCHAFGEVAHQILPKWLDSKVDEILLTGSEGLGIDPVFHRSEEYRKRFKNHLEALQGNKNKIGKEKWDDWLCALALVGVSEAINDVLVKNNLNPMDYVSVIAECGRSLVSRMPTRVLDVHLHWQVLKNPQYSPKISDLEDWAGLGVASCYCDLVVCEKHFADLLCRDGYAPNAKMETNLGSLFEHFSH